ncbi:MAG: 4-hydroxythreonine-4-phosphate dehydrogenase, partial [Gammaproteobacteria bacterium]
LEQAATLALAGEVAASVMAPVNAKALIKGNAIDKVISTNESARYLTLISGPLRVVHVFDHVLMEDVCKRMSTDLVLGAIRKTHECLAPWGIAQPRIAVAGLNPHAHGPQEKNAIAPAIEIAQSEGINVTGPIAPDTVFRHCIEDRFDVVVAMCHDQGHIAIKTWGFVGNCALFLGAPYLFMSVGHGTAYDIAGKGIANHEMILAAILQGASLASGRGFLQA